MWKIKLFPQLRSGPHEKISVPRPLSNSYPHWLTPQTLPKTPQEIIQKTFHFNSVQWTTQRYKASVAQDTSTVQIKSTATKMASSLQRNIGRLQAWSALKSNCRRLQHVKNKNNWHNCERDRSSAKIIFKSRLVTFAGIDISDRRRIMTSGNTRKKKDQWNSVYVDFASNRLARILS